MANKFTLSGHHVDVSYTIGANPSFPALTYQDETISKDFLPNAIHTDPTDLGNLITVAGKVVARVQSSLSDSAAYIDGNN